MDKIWQDKMESDMKWYDMEWNGMIWFRNITTCFFTSPILSLFFDILSSEPGGGLVRVGK